MVLAQQVKPLLSLFVFVPLHLSGHLFAFTRYINSIKNLIRFSIRMWSANIGKRLLKDCFARVDINTAAAVLQIGTERQKSLAIYSWCVMFSIAIMMLAYCVKNKGDAKIAFAVFHQPRAQLLICHNKMLSLTLCSPYLSFSLSSILVNVELHVLRHAPGRFDLCMARDCKFTLGNGPWDCITYLSWQ